MDFRTEYVELRSIISSNTPKTCQTYKELTDVSTYLLDQLFSHDLICEIYSAATDEAVKGNILPAFTDPDGSIRIVIATIALGLDAPNVRQIIV